MKEYQLPLLSFTIPLNENPFDVLSRNYRISYCELPEYIKSETEHWKIFPKLHNWAKDEITDTYHVDRGNLRIYILTPNTPNTRLLKKKSLFYEEFPCPIKPVSQLNLSPQEQAEISLKLLFGHYFNESTPGEGFVRSTGNANFFIFIQRKENQAKYIKVLQATLCKNHLHSDNKRASFYVRDAATRMKALTLSDYKKKLTKKIPYTLEKGYRKLHPILKATSTQETTGKQK